MVEPPTSRVNQEQERVRDAVAEHMEAYRVRDWRKVLRRTYPPLVEIMGGRDDALKALRASSGSSEQTFTILRVQVPPMTDFYFGDKRMFCVVPVSLRTLQQNMLVDVVSFQVGIMPMGDRTWTFVDGGLFTDALVEELFPDLPPAVRLPVIQSRVIGPATEELLQQYHDARSSGSGSRPRTAPHRR
jgi:hypothetical protein